MNPRKLPTRDTDCSVVATTVSRSGSSGVGAVVFEVVLCERIDAG